MTKIQSDDMKKETAKMMKKINEVAERSENLESQVIFLLSDQDHLGDEMIVRQISQ